MPPIAPEIIDVTKRGAGRLAAFECLVAAEAARRDRQREPDLAKLEATHFGPELGAIRRVFNKIFLERMRLGGTLLDYGCGGARWKEDYWPRFDRVIAAEIDRTALTEIGPAFPQAELWYTRNGSIEPREQVDVILSSSVIGYILPAQAEEHVKSCAELLKPGGQLIVTRVLPYNLWAFVRGVRLIAVEDTSFVYHYSKAELLTLLRRYGFRELSYIALGARIPLLPWRANQRLYEAFPRLMARWLPCFMPFLKIHHMVVAIR